MERRATTSRRIVEQLEKAGVDLAVTLPDTWMAGLFDEIRQSDQLEQLPVAAESEGVGICAGAYFGGKSSCLIMANAGLMLCGYALPTLVTMHRIPLLMLISYRGKIGDTAFYQEQQGVVTEPFLRAMGVEYAVVDSPTEIPLVGEAYRYSRAYRRPAAILLGKRVLLDTAAA